MKFYIRGGIGDLLQHYEFIKDNLDKEYLVHMHFKNARSIFDQIGAFNCLFYEFDDAISLSEQTNSIFKDFIDNNKDTVYETPRSFYCDFDFGQEANLNASNLVNSFKTKNPIIGIHPFRSDFANSVYSSYNLPAKIISSNLIKRIMNKQNNYLIFGSEKELLNYGLQETENVKFVSFQNILHSLSVVKHCSYLIGLDSCFKSMSSMQKIKTLCIIGDFNDAIRDAMFIKRYEEDGVMKVLRINNQENEDKIINFIKQNN